MPLVPDQPSVGIRPAAAPSQRVGGVTADAFGAGIGRAIKSVGSALAQASDVASRVAIEEATKDNERDAKRRFLEYNTALQENTKGFFASEGQNTVDSYSQTLIDADDLGKSHLQAVSDNRVVAESLQLAIQGQRFQLQKQADNHNANQKKVVDDNQYGQLISQATNDAIEGYKSFGAGANFVFNSEKFLDSDPEGVPADAVLDGEAAVRFLTEDKARKDGEIPGAKVEQAVADYYDSVVRAAVADGNPSTALRIFNANRDKIRGEKGVALKNFLKDQTTNDVSLTIARNIYGSVRHLPLEQRLAAAQTQLLKITDYAKSVSVKNQFESLLRTDATIRGLEVPSQAREKVMGLLNSGMSPAQVSIELNKTKDSVTREAELAFLSSWETINANAKKEIAEDFAGQIYRMEDDDAKVAEAKIKEEYRDDPESQGIALAHLKSLVGVDESLLKVDLPSRADKTKKEIIAEIGKIAPEGAAIATMKAAAILKAEDIKDAGEKLLVIAGLNSFYGSLEGFDSERAADAGMDLVDKVSKTNDTQAGKIEAVQRSDVTSKTKTIATAILRSLDVATRKDDKATKDAAASAMSAAMAQGQSPGEFRASSEENAAKYDLVATDGPLMSGMVASFRLAQEGIEFPFVSDKGAMDELRTMTDDELVDLNLERFRGFLNRADTNTLASRKRAAISKRKTENARVANTVARLINRLQPYNKKGKPQLTKGVLAKVDNYVWTQIDDAQEAGVKLQEEDVRKMVISAFTVIEFSPDDPGFFESIFGLDRGGATVDVAGALIGEMSDAELNTLRVDEDNFPVEMDRFLQIAVDGWKRRNLDSGEPSDDDLELLRGNVLKFVLKNQGNR